MDNAHMMLIVGICLLAWVMLRAKLRRGRQRQDVNHDLEHIKRVANSCSKNLVLASGSSETAQLQSAMFDLQRDLIGELDTRAAAVRMLIEQADRKIAQLRALSEQICIPEKSNTDGVRSVTWNAADISQLANSGWPSEQIVRYLGCQLSHIEAQKNTTDFSVRRKSNLAMTDHEVRNLS